MCDICIEIDKRVEEDGPALRKTTDLPTIDRINLAISQLYADRVDCIKIRPSRASLAILPFRSLLTVENLSPIIQVSYFEQPVTGETCKLSLGRWRGTENVPCRQQISSGNTPMKPC